MEQYSVGIATGDITPPVGCPLWGWVSRGPHASTGVYHPLRTVATAIGDGSTTVIIVSAEIIGFGSLADRVRAGIAQATDVPPENVILSATHTHCGPTIDPGEIGHDERVDFDYIHRAAETMAATARTAWRYRFPARLGFGVGRCGFAINRRLPDPARPGETLFAPNPRGPVDHEVSVLAASSPDGIVRAVLFSYACHPTSRSGLRIGGDYPGFAYDRIEEAFDHAQPAFLQGCGADQKARPPDPRAKTFMCYTIDQLREIGSRLADAVVGTVKDGLEPVSGPIAVRRRVLPILSEPLDRAMVTAELRNTDINYAYKREWALHHKERLDAGIPEVRETPFEIQTLRFGDSLAAAALAGEVVVEYALRMKKDLRPRFRHILPLAYANRAVGYIPTRAQFEEGGYEVLDANQYAKRTGRFLPDTEDRIHAAIAGMLGADAGKPRRGRPTAGRR